jgi:hypothetical protein
MRPRVLLAAGVAATAVLAGCGTSTPAEPTRSPSPSAAPLPEEVVCEEYADTGSLVRTTAESLERQPVLPAAVALVLFDSRRIAATAGVLDPELQAAQAELVAAIDDLDAQGQALLGPGGNPAQTAVQLDAARILAAVTEIERVCAGR